MQAEVIAIGDELTSGQRLDTNSQWLSRRLGDLGIQVPLHTTVADDLAVIEQVLRLAARRVQIVVCTGGLGPTADDLTRHALAAAGDCELVQDDEQLRHIRQLFAHRRREMPQRNVIQAMFPRGSRVIPNPHGTAPGIEMQLPAGNEGGATVFALPGVPAEMHEMWDASVAPRLQQLQGGKAKIIVHYQLKCFGAGESDIEQRLPDLIRRGRQPSVGITASRATITLRVTAEGDAEEDCLLAMQPTIDTIHACLGDLVFGQGEEELQHAVVRQLSARGRTLATAEWGPGGMLADWLSEASTSSGVYLGGLVVRSQSALAAVIAAACPQTTTVPQDELTALAQACRRQFAADYGLAVGPFPDRNERRSVPFAMADERGTVLQSAPFSGHPEILKARCTKHVLNALRLHLA